MAATSTRSVPELLTEIRAARARVAAHKLTIKTTRQELAAAAAELLELEAECKRRGLAVVNQQPAGVGANHGRQNDPRSHN
jgi:hypothetical protein